MAGALLCTAAGCSHATTAPGGADAPAPSPYPPPRPDTLDGSAALPVSPPVTAASPDQITRAALAVMYAWDTGRDSGPATATRRALPYLTAPLSRDVQLAPPVASPGEPWLTWAAHHARLQPTITPAADDTPPPTSTITYRQYQITQTIHGDGGWASAPRQLTAFVTLVHTPAGWRVSQVQAQ